MWSFYLVRSSVPGLRLKFCRNSAAYWKWRGGEKGTRGFETGGNLSYQNSTATEFPEGRIVNSVS